jgi:hypothetical protein
MWRDFFNRTGTGIPSADDQVLGISFMFADANVFKVNVCSQILQNKQSC